jgi:hypothetical protein
MHRLLLTACLCVLTACGYLSWPECLELMEPVEELIVSEIEKENEDAVIAR